MAVHIPTAAWAHTVFDLAAWGAGLAFSALLSAVDLGDGIGRHPVQLYESAAMALFLAVYLVGLARRQTWALRRGFYALCLWYGLTRFGWEFLKPYPGLIGPFNLFHILSG